MAFYNYRIKSVRISVLKPKLHLFDLLWIRCTNLISGVWPLINCSSVQFITLHCMIVVTLVFRVKCYASYEQTPLDGNSRKTAASWSRYFHHENNHSWTDTWNCWRPHAVSMSPAWRRNRSTKCGDFLFRRYENKIMTTEHSVPRRHKRARFYASLR